MSKTIEHFFKPVGGDCSTAVPTTAVLAVWKEVVKEMNKVVKAGQNQGADTVISKELKS